MEWGSETQLQSPISTRHFGRFHPPARWPQVNQALIDEQLSADMAMAAQRGPAWGHAARQNANLKVRQPLAQVVVRTRNASRRGVAAQPCTNWCSTVSNVKEMSFTHASGDLVMVVFRTRSNSARSTAKGYPKIRQAMRLAGPGGPGGALPGRRNGRDRGRESYAVAPEDEVRVTPRAGFKAWRRRPAISSPSPPS